MVRFLFLTLFLFQFVLFGQDIKVSAYTDTTDYIVGDYIYLTITVEHAKETEVLIPSVKDSLKEIDLIENKGLVSKENNGKLITSNTFVLAKYDSAEVKIPSLPILYRDKSGTDKSDSTYKTAFTNPILIRVHTVQVNIQEEIKDVKPPVTIPLDWKIIAMWILIGLIVIAAAIFIYFRYIKKKETEERKIPKIILPPDVEALNKLETLELKQLWQRGEIKEYHSGITEIIREYFERRFHFPALELTTSEVNLFISEKIGRSRVTLLVNNFLANADLVKFAKYQPGSEINQEMMSLAKEIVNETKAVIVREDIIV